MVPNAADDAEVSYEAIVLAALRGPGEPCEVVVQGFAESQEEKGAKKELLQIALREVARRLAGKALEASQPVLEFTDDSQNALIPRLLKLVDELTQQKHIEDNMEYTVLEDLVDMSSIEECKDLFSDLEARLQRLGEASGRPAEGPGTPMQVSNNVQVNLRVLRICNTILGRLSKANHAHFAGRVLMFLAKHFDLYHRSGINLSGAINTSHSTPVEEVSETFHVTFTFRLHLSNIASKFLPILSQGAKDAADTPINAEFFKVFWGLQSVFQRPALEVVADANQWAELVRSLKSVVDEFNKIKVLSGGVSGAAGSSETGITVKYLSSSRLFGLQLRDAAFRRHFLLQAIIFLHACRNRRRPPTAEEAKAAEAGKRPSSSALKPKQLTEMDEVEGLLIRQLDLVPEFGKLFREAVQRVLQRETHWVTWKAEKCQAALQRAPQALPAIPPKPARRRPLMARRVRMGTSELDALWGLGYANEDSMGYDDSMYRSWDGRVAEIQDQMIQADAANDGKQRSEKVPLPSMFSWHTLRHAVSREAWLFMHANSDLEEVVHDWRQTNKEEPLPRHAAKQPGRVDAADGKDAPEGSQLTLPGPEGEDPSAVDGPVAKRPRMDQPPEGTKGVAPAANGAARPGLKKPPLPRGRPAAAAAPAPEEKAVPGVQAKGPEAGPDDDGLEEGEAVEDMETEQAPVEFLMDDELGAVEEAEEEGAGGEGEEAGEIPGEANGGGAAEDEHMEKGESTEAAATEAKGGKPEAHVGGKPQKGVEAEEPMPETGPAAAENGHVSSLVEKGAHGEGKDGEEEGEKEEEMPKKATAKRETRGKSGASAVKRSREVEPEEETTPPKRGRAASGSKRAVPKRAATGRATRSSGRDKNKGDEDGDTVEDSQ